MFLYIVIDWLKKKTISDQNVLHDLIILYYAYFAIFSACFRILYVFKNIFNLKKKTIITKQLFVFHKYQRVCR